MGQTSLIFRNISFSYPSSANNLISSFSTDIGIGWTGIIGPNGSGKTTLLKLATGELNSDTGRITFSGRTRYCRQRTDHPPENFSAFLTSFDKPACRLMSLLNIDPDWEYRWTTLSHGERKRAQIATVLYERPDILAVDEPTNHLDTDARQWVIKALALFKGIGLLVSHDRELLDRLSKKCMFIDPPDISITPGNYTRAVKLKHQAATRLEKEHTRAKHRVRQLEKEEERRRRAAAMSDKRMSKKKLASKDRDAKNKINLAKVSGKDSGAGKRMNQIGGRLSQARAILSRTRFKKKYKTGFHLTGSASKRKILLHLNEGRISLAPDKQLLFNDLYIRPGDRIGITGPNGCGKTTLLRYIVHALSHDNIRICYLPQEIHLAEATKKSDGIRQLPGNQLGKIMTIISRLDSRPDRLLETRQPSPGEIRKILLAQSISTDPQLIIMDEPTNHLDLLTVSLLEDALCDSPCALLLVSHDLIFIEKLTQKRWDISMAQPDSERGIFKCSFILTEQTGSPPC